MKPDQKIKKLTMTALMAAVVFVVTYVIRVPMPVASGGYANVGDASVYMAAALLGGPAGMAAAAIGSGLADILAGAGLYIPATIVIKGLMGFICGKLMEREGFARFLIAAIIGGAIMVGGYAAYEAAVVFQENPVMALLNVPMNLVQWACGVAVASAFYPAMPRIKRSLA